MNNYTFQHIIEELVQDRLSSSTGRGKGIPQGKEDIYISAWQSVNLWLESRLRQRNGAELGLLGKFTWEFKKDKLGQISFRPIFILGSSFSKEHHIRTQRLHYNQVIAPCEDINYSKLAIKFSKTLTKDILFASVRDIIKKIGDFVDRFYDFQVEFSFGVMRSKQRKVQFEFNLDKIQRLLPEDASSLYMPDDYDFVDESENGSEPNNSIISPTPRTPLTPSSTSYFDSPNSKESSPSSSSFYSPTATNIKNIATFELNLSPDGKGNNKSKGTPVLDAISPPLTPTLTPTSLTHSQPVQEISPRTQEILMTLDKPLEPRLKNPNQQKRNKVQEQAFIDTIISIQNKAKDVDRIKYAEHLKILSMEKSLKAQKEKFHNNLTAYQKDLDHQIEVYHKKVYDEKVERRSGKVISIINDDADGRPAGSNGIGPTIRELRADLDTLLLQQIERKSKTKTIMKENKAREEQLFLDHIAMESDLQMVRDRIGTLEQQKELLEQWERQSHLKNLRKLEESSYGDVANYLDKNLPDLSPSKHAMQSSSIGFDFRRK